MLSSSGTPDKESGGFSDLNGGVRGGGDAEPVCGDDGAAAEEAVARGRLAAQRYG